ncbi:alpha/beta hydrolase family protein [Marininema halotolerans]|uniref:Dipeptidyl aminopeptidase/acylaminoacyl peptidase n=1 Tax=Marininema halotolerans TaxID=1155944 RepID=A0A1I6SSU4_9BACL|nr:S9 family peptidase [Marininema halotolerans]SFS80015.1 Dipeptidyl aminopeptidase/acylaminoacyl peptidase [Marininema halotolerans]
MTSSITQSELRRYLEIRSAYAPSYHRMDKSVAFLSTMSGLPQVWRMGEAPWPQQLTFFSERVMGMSASPTQDIFCLWKDQGGNERSQLYLMDGDGLSIENLTNDPQHIYRFGSWAPDGRRFSYTSNQRDGVHFDIYLYDVKNRQHDLLLESDHTNHAGEFSPDGRSLLFALLHSNSDNDWYLLDLDSKQSVHLTPHTEDALYQRLTFSSDGNSLFLLSNQESEFSRVARLHLDTKHWCWLTEDHWDAEDLTLSHDRNLLAYSKNENGSSQIYLLETATHHHLPIPTNPPGVVGDLSWSQQDNSLAFTLSSPLDANEIWQFHLQHAHYERLTYASLSGRPREPFVTPELIQYTSFDQLSIPGFYYRPHHRSGPYPVIIWVHGGPESQSRNGFNSLFQFFLSRGIAIFVPNVRGSSGYGHTYVHLDDVRKRMDSVADLAWGVQWLQRYGNAQPDAIGIMGGSYGGFMVLAALTHYPDLWAAGVDIVGIANLRTFIQNTSSYRRHLRESEYGTIENDGEFFDQISPIHHVEQIKAPLFVIHGANDPRVPVNEAEQIVTALRKKEHSVEYLRFEDEGHGVVKLENRINAYAAVAEFLDRWLSKPTNSDQEN